MKIYSPTRRQTSSIMRMVAIVLILIQPLTTLPQQLWATNQRSGIRGQGSAGIKLTPDPRPLTPVHVNRTVPKVQPLSVLPVFSLLPTAAEIRTARVFEEPLIPVGGRPSLRENRALAKSLLAYAKAGNSENVSIISDFMDRYPKSVWRASLLTNLGIVYRRMGYGSKALAAWEEAWRLAKNETELKSQALADRAVGELADLTARLGLEPRLAALLAELDKRDLHGPATEKITGARETLWLMRHRPEQSLLCGPYALSRVWLAVRPTETIPDKMLASRATAQGTTLAQLKTLANDAQMNYQIAWRRPGARLLLPSVVHWKLGHFGALIKEENGRYLIQDPALDAGSGGEAWVSPAVLDTEASGYFLVPEGTLPEGWHAVAKEEGARVWGKGQTDSHDSGATARFDAKAGGCPPKRGMAGYSMHVLLASLNIVDTPVGYSPPHGPDMYFTVRYNHREAFQPANFNYSNLGPKWTFDWLSYITDDPNNPSVNVSLYVRGGGTKIYTGFSPTNPVSTPQIESGAVLVRNSPTGYTQYERRLPDGSKEIFDRLGSSLPRKIFMTRAIDPVGNTITFTYDDNFRLVAVADALNQVTTLSYDLPADNLKITKVTDPFGRFATFEYYPDGQLKKITDVIGLTSEFTYGTGNFINTMTTPYGTTRFAFSDRDAVNRWVEATDPLGDKERVEFRHEAPGIQASEEVGAPRLDPRDFPGFPGFSNEYLQWRNSFYWDKKAWREYPNDYTKARIFHWLHGLPCDFSHCMTANVLESEKNPLENRVWYSYPGQTYPRLIRDVTYAQPAKVARVLDDGTVQLYQFEYNAIGRVTKTTDPVGRVLSYVYAPNQIDLLEVRQTRGTNNELLARFTYNDLHLPLSMTDTSGQITRFTYNAFGQLLTGTNPRNETTTLTYDDNGYLTHITGPVPGATTDLTYDEFGRVQTVTDSEGYILTFDYDAADRPTRVTYPDATFQQIEYDRLDPVRTIDRLGRITTRTYDALRQLVSIRDALDPPRITQFQYCGCGSLQKIIDPMNRETTWDYDVQGRATRKVFPDGSRIRYIYESTTSRLAEVTDAKGQRTEYEYFIDNSLKQVNYADGMVPTPSVSFTYDPNYNRVLTVQDGIGTTTYTYNPITPTPAIGAGRLATVAGPLPNSTITYQYDELGRANRRAVNGVPATVNYDTLGRVTQVTNPLGTFNYGYVNTTDRWGRIDYPNGQRTLFSYYGNAGDQRLQEIQHLNPASQIISKFNYTYNAEGQITNWTKQADAQPPTAYTFDYDAVDQLLGATSENPAASQFSYGYDRANNRTSEQIDDQVTISGYNSLNQLVSQQGGALPDPDSVVRRSEVEYDGLGRRARIIEKEDDVVVSDKRFLWCGTEVCEERDATGGTVTKRFYAQGVQVGGNNYFYARDHLGSVREMTDTQGEIRARYDYDPFGRRIKLSGDLEADFGFTGQYFHGPTGLGLALYRSYDPNLGRWVSRDPIAEGGGLNLYAYVSNNPINRIDPLGLDDQVPEEAAPKQEPPKELTRGQRVQAWLRSIFRKKVLEASGLEKVVGKVEKNSGSCPTGAQALKQIAWGDSDVDAEKAQHDARQGSFDAVNAAGETGGVLVKKAVDKVTGLQVNDKLQPTKSSWKRFVNWVRNLFSSSK